MSTRKIAVSTFWQIASQIVMAALSILAVKFVAIGLTKELAGNYNSAYGFLQLFGILADFGLYAVSIREVSRAADQRKMLSVIFSIRIVILAVSFGSALLLVWAVPAWRGTPFPLSVTIAAFVPCFNLLAGMLRAVFQVKYQMHFVFIAEVIQRIITTGLIGLFIAFGFRGSADVNLLCIFLAIGGLGSLVLFLIELVFSRRLIPLTLQWDTAIFKDVMRLAAPFGLAYLCIALFRQFDLTMIAFLRPDFELQNAYYGFVVRMVDMGFVIPTFLLNSTLPILSASHERGEDTSQLLGRTLLTLLLLCAVAALFSFFWSRPLTLLLTTPAYLSTALAPGSDTALRLQAIPLFCNGFILFAFYALLIKGEWKRLVLTLLLSSGLSILLNLLLIPKLGFVGSASGAIVVHVFLTVLLFPQALSAFRVAFGWKECIRFLGFSLLLACALAFVAPLLTTDIRTAVALASMSVFMGALAWATGLIAYFRKA